MPKPIFYTDSGLDRADGLREDPSWVEDLLRDPRAQVLPVWNDKVLVARNSEPTLLPLTGEAAQAAAESAGEIVLLGHKDGVGYFAADISGLSETDATALVAGEEFTDLRPVAPTMERSEGSILAYARGMLLWHRRHRFCGDCGHPTENTEGGHVRRCTNPDCRRPHFPRTDPAVIMLVTRPGPGGGACLLGHKSAFLPGMYSTLAGFVEIGETLEEAVAREVMEETGIATTDIQYRASQPWPFPASLMLGYRAVATSFDITINTDELDDAAWFTRDDIARMGENGKRLPRPDSIALWLIEEWLAEG